MERLSEEQAVFLDVADDWGAQSIDEIRWMNRLGENLEEVTMGLGVLEKLGRFRITGKQNDSAEGHDRGDLERCLDPVHTSHKDVHD